MAVLLIVPEFGGFGEELFFVDFLEGHGDRDFAVGIVNGVGQQFVVAVVTHHGVNPVVVGEGWSA